MIAKRRARKRSLIRSNSMNTVTIKSPSSVDEVAAFQTGPSDVSYTTPLSARAMPSPQLDLTTYLRHLSTLHAAGILTDEEFSAARGRLFGS